MQLETPRLFLRELTGDDLPALFAVLGDAGIMRYYPYSFDEARVRSWIARNIQRYGILGFGLWAVVRKETGRLIGDCGLTMQNINGVIRPEIGYHIRRDDQRQGYAAEAARTVRDWAFANTPFQILYSYMKQANVPSSAVAMANGMRKVEEFTDQEQEISVVYAITRAQWRRMQEEKP